MAVPLPAPVFMSRRRIGMAVHSGSSSAVVQNLMLRPSRMPFPTFANSLVMAHTQIWVPNFQLNIQEGFAMIEDEPRGVTLDKWVWVWLSISSSFRAKKRQMTVRKFNVRLMQTHYLIYWNYPDSPGSHRLEQNTRVTSPETNTLPLCVGHVWN